MNIFFLRSAIIVFLALLGSSVLPMLFPAAAAFPVVVFAFSAVLSLSRGFVRSLLPIIFLGVLFEVASLGRIGLLSAFMVGTAYVVSFLSRRFVVEHGVSAHIFSGIAAGAASISYPVLSPIFLGGDILFGVLSLERVLFVAAGAFFMIAVFSAGLRKFDEWTTYLDPQRVFRNL